MKDDSLYKGRWKVFKHQKNEFSLSREELEKENVWLEYNGIMKVNESLLKYGVVDVLEEYGWEKIFYDREINFGLFSNGDLKSANRYELRAVADILETHFEFGTSSVMDYDLHNNVILIVCLEFYLYLSNPRSEYKKTLTILSQIFKHVNDNWNVDFINHLVMFAEKEYSEDNTSGNILTELFDKLGYGIVWD